MDVPLQVSASNDQVAVLSVVEGPAVKVGDLFAMYCTYAEVKLTE
jgi:hypothetical protein